MAIWCCGLKPKFILLKKIFKKDIINNPKDIFNLEYKIEEKTINITKLNGWEYLRL